MAKVHIGLSGYSYKPWQGEDRFYPPEIKQKGFLDFYVGRYDSVEMDGTWYQMPKKEAVQSYIDRTPENFTLCFKLHRNITHVARLKETGDDSLKFMLGRLVPLARTGRLGPLLVQLPPNLKRDDERLARFLSVMPRSVPVEDDGGPVVPIKYAIEFRNETWHAPEVEEMLRADNVAWVCSDTDEADGQRRDTADFHYIRMRKSDYAPDALDKWAEYYNAATASGKDLFVFCKHEDEGHPWIWADYLLTKVQ